MKKGSKINGPLEKKAKQVGRLGEDTESCDRIVWNSDSSKVAFVVNGVRLDVYDAAVQMLSARLPLVEEDGYPSSREARAVAFSADGLAVEFCRLPAVTG